MTPNLEIVMLMAVPSGLKGRATTEKPRGAGGVVSSETTFSLVARGLNPWRSDAGLLKLTRMGGGGEDSVRPVYRSRSRGGAAYAWSTETTAFSRSPK